jgi:hypothetical protein
MSQNGRMLPNDVLREQLRVIRANTAKRATRISAPAMAEVLSALDGYWDELEASDLSEKSKGIYMAMADNFVRWMRNDFVPGSRMMPRRVKTDAPRSLIS